MHEHRTAKKNRQSLVAKKQQQWKREREEMQALNSCHSPYSNLSNNKMPDDYKVNASFARGYEQFKGCSLQRRPDVESSSYSSETVTASHSENFSVFDPQRQHTPMSTITEDTLALSGSGEDVIWNYEKACALPKWVQRRLKMPEGQILLINNNSSPEYLSQHLASESGSELNSYVRGQNNFLEPRELLEREKRRKRAVEHQREIRKQLAEKEQKRKEDRERRINEELKEEMRIEKETEVERKRIAEEQRVAVERLQTERQKQEKIHEAILKAEKDALNDKRKLRLAKVAPCSPPTHVPPVRNPSFEVDKERDQEAEERQILQKDVDLESKSHLTGMSLELHQYLQEQQQQQKQQQQQYTFLIPPIFLPNYYAQNESRLAPVKSQAQGILSKDVSTQTEVEQINQVQNSRPSTSAMLMTVFEKLKIIEDYQKSLIVNHNQSQTKTLSFKDATVMSTKESLNDLKKNMVVERPKWGAHHTSVKYTKQSEKDLGRKGAGSQHLQQQQQQRQRIPQIQKKNNWIRHDETIATTTANDLSNVEVKSEEGLRYNFEDNDNDTDNDSDESDILESKNVDVKSKSKFFEKKASNFEFLKRPEKETCIDELLMDNFERLDFLHPSDWLL